MRSLLFKLTLLIVLLVPLGVHAETPSIAGEDLFNETVEKAAKGKVSLNPVDIFNMISDDLLGEIRDCTDDVIIIFVLAAISGIVKIVSDSIGGKSTGEAAFFACFTLMSAAAVKCFFTALQYGTDVVKSMTDFITKLSPMFMVTVAATGKAVSAASFQPVLSAAVYIVSIVIEKCLVPLVTFSSVLAVAGNISEKVQLSGFGKVVKSISKWIMAAIITIFTGISAIYGFSAPSFDAVGGKAIKFAVGSLVPVVGTFLSDTMETVVNGARLMKNAVGTAGIVVICVICAIPVMKIAVMQLMLKLTSAIAEPLTDKRISKMMWDVSESVTTIFAVVVMVAVMFIINISIMIAVTNGG